jgi:formate-dependent phosphoribosylglycinamide formyltransferase (GAR transformylase)
MSSSGKGQSTIKTDADIEKAWQYAVEGSRGDVVEVIVEAFVKFTGDHFINCCPKQQSYFVHQSATDKNGRSRKLAACNNFR